MDVDNSEFLLGMKINYDESFNESTSASSNPSYKNLSNKGRNICSDNTKLEFDRAFTRIRNIHEFQLPVKGPINVNTLPEYHSRDRLTDSFEKMDFSSLSSTASESGISTSCLNSIIKYSNELEEDLHDINRIERTTSMLNYFDDQLKVLSQKIYFQKNEKGLPINKNSQQIYQQNSQRLVSGFESICSSSSQKGALNECSETTDALKQYDNKQPDNIIHSSEIFQSGKYDVDQFLNENKYACVEHKYPTSGYLSELKDISPFNLKSNKNNSFFNELGSELTKQIESFDLNSDILDLRDFSYSNEVDYFSASNKKKKHYKKYLIADSYFISEDDNYLDSEVTEKKLEKYNNPKYDNIENKFINFNKNISYFGTKEDNDYVKSVSENSYPIICSKKDLSSRVNSTKSLSCLHLYGPDDYLDTNIPENSSVNTSVYNKSGEYILKQTLETRGSNRSEKFSFGNSFKRPENTVNEKKKTSQYFHDPHRKSENFVPDVRNQQDCMNNLSISKKVYEDKISDNEINSRSFQSNKLPYGTNFLFKGDNNSRENHENNIRSKNKESNSIDFKLEDFRECNDMKYQSVRLQDDSNPYYSSNKNISDELTLSIIPTTNNSIVRNKKDKSIKYLNQDISESNLLESKSSLKSHNDHQIYDFALPDYVIHNDLNQKVTNRAAGSLTIKQNTLDSFFNSQKESSNKTISFKNEDEISNILRYKNNRFSMNNTSNNHSYNFNIANKNNEIMQMEGVSKKSILNENKYRAKRIKQNNICDSNQSLIFNSHQFLHKIVQNSVSSLKENDIFSGFKDSFKKTVLHGTKNTCNINNQNLSPLDRSLNIEYSLPERSKGKKYRRTTDINRLKHLLKSTDISNNNDLKYSREVIHNNEEILSSSNIQRMNDNVNHKSKIIYSDKSFDDSFISSNSKQNEKSSFKSNKHLESLSGNTFYSVEKKLKTITTNFIKNNHYKKGNEILNIPCLSRKKKLDNSDIKLGNLVQNRSDDIFEEIINDQEYGNSILSTISSAPRSIDPIN